MHRVIESSWFCDAMRGGRLVLKHPRIFRVRSHLTKRERIVLYALARAAASRGPICEIGSYLGASACALAAGAGDAPADAVVVCVDTWGNEAMAEGRRDTWKDFGRNTRPYGERIRPVRGRSVEVAAEAARVAGAPWALLFLDGDHSEEGVRQDWDSYRPYLGGGAIVAFHDIGWAEGVQRLVREEVDRQLAWSRRLPNLLWGELR